MSLRYTVAAAFAWGLMATAAQAGPTAVGLRPTVGEISNIEKVAERCWIRNGQKHCRPSGQPRVGAYRDNRSDYFVQDASKLPVGSKQWWYVKEREGSTGNP
jgi:hypothetical protein